ncbi:MAG: hypothetical protein ABI596_11140 [Pyrinomonadaceae bacterium]
MSFIKRMDAGLMNFMTQLRFPLWASTPSQRFLFSILFYLLMACLFGLPPFLIRGQVGAFNYVVIAVYLVAVFYHWRLWRRLKTSH